MAPPIKYMVPATMVLSSLVYFMTTISHIFGGPGGLATMDVQILDGRIRGLKKISRSGRSFYEFRGIPYATQPQNGYLRFEPPIPPQPWNDTLDATNFGAFCLQYEFLTGVLQGDEPCLFLNVATPKVLSPEEVQSGVAAPFPVIVYLYGGGFMRFSNVYNPSYFMDENIVVVSMNYRLGVFGFFSTNDGVVTGNQGLKDQAMALRWVQNNIMYFNGDPNRVTLMGQSAGGASAHLHSLSPMSKNLFHRVISQSGNGLNYFVLNPKPREQALRVGRFMNCPTNDTKLMVACLRSKSALELNKVNKEYINLLSPRTAIFTPVVEVPTHDENTFLPDTPANLIRQGKVSHPIIAGLNSNDGLFFAMLLLQGKGKLNKLNEEWEKHAPVVFGYEDQPADRRRNISHAIRNYYIGNNNISWDNVVDLGMMVSDRYFFQGFYNLIRLQSNVTPVYSYEFRYSGEFSLASILLHMTSFLPKTLGLFYSIARNWFSKTILRSVETRMDGCHLDEIPLFFHLSVISNYIVPGSVDYPMSNAAIALWTSFARDGKPDNLFGVEWKPVPKNASIDQDSIRSLKFDDQPIMFNESFRKRIEFWESLDLDRTNCFDNSNEPTAGSLC